MAYYMLHLSRRLQNLVLLLVIVPFWTSSLVRIFAWSSLLHSDGFIKQLLVGLALINPDTSLLYNSGCVVLVSTYTLIPFGILPLYAAAERFDLSLLDAARDLGASAFEAFYKVFIPGISRGLLSTFLIVFVPALGSYLVPDLVGGTSSEMIGNKIAERAFINRDLPLASALAAVFSLITLLPLIAYWTHNQIKKSTDEN